MGRPDFPPLRQGQAARQQAGHARDRRTMSCVKQEVRNENKPTCREARPACHAGQRTQTRHGLLRQPARPFGTRATGRIRHLGASGLRIREQFQRMACAGHQPGHLRLPHAAAYRGPLFLGIDTHALSEPAFSCALEVLAAYGVEVMLADKDDYTPTPVISHAILTYNRGRDKGLADGIVITPSHNPPDSGGFKYNPPNGGPADKDVTGWMEARANALLESGLKGVKRIPLEQARRAATTHRHDFVTAYVGDLGSVLDMEAIRGAGISLGVDPLGGAGVHYWGPIAERYGLNLTIVNDAVDPTFRFMTVDWDGRIRMDPSSSYAMQSLIGLKDRFDIAF